MMLIKTTNDLKVWQQMATVVYYICYNELMKLLKMFNTVKC
jgi:hypothetical protein